METLNAGQASCLPYSLPVGEPFQTAFGPCRSTQMDLIARGEVKSYLVGDRRGRRMIITQSYLDYVGRQRQREAAGEIGVASPNPRARKRQPAAAPVGNTKREETRQRRALAPRRDKRRVVA
jgi:hypothetical protein